MRCASRRRCPSRSHGENLHEPPVRPRLARMEAHKGCVSVRAGFSLGVCASTPRFGTLAISVNRARARSHARSHAHSCHRASPALTPHNRAELHQDLIESAVTATSPSAGRRRHSRRQRTPPLNLPRCAGLLTSTRQGAYITAHTQPALAALAGWTGMTLFRRRLRCNAGTRALSGSCVGSS